MSEMQEVEISISADGEVEVKIFGVKGPKCEEITEQIRQLLGNEVVSHERTDEFSQTSQVTENEQEVGEW